MKSLQDHLETLRRLENDADKTARTPFRQFCQAPPPGMARNEAVPIPAGSPVHSAARDFNAVQLPGIDRQDDDPIADARARGWSVQDGPAGLLVQCRGRSYDPDLLDRLHAMMIGSEIQQR